MKQINLFFAVQVLRRKSGVYIFWKYFKKMMNGILNREKTLRQRVLKISSVKYIVLKITYKKYVQNNYFSVCAAITWSLSQFRDTAKLKVFKKSVL